MDKAEVEILFDDSSKSYLLRGTNNDYFNYSKYCVYDGFLAIKVMGVNSDIDRSLNQISVVNENGIQIGELLLCKGQEFKLSSMNDALYCAYINEISSLDFGLPGKFQHDYFYIRKALFPYYKGNYFSNSPLWGGFIHEEQLNSLPGTYVRPQPLIVARKINDFPTEILKDIATKSVLQYSSLERFLKEYHLLEMLFDWQIVKSIKELDDNLIGIGKLLVEYRKDELSLLQNIIISKCVDITGVIKIFNLLNWNKGAGQSYLYLKANEIFNDYSKESNPFKQKFEKFEDLFTAGGVDEKIVKKLQLGSPSYEIFVKSVTAYWIYRVRCSIAHNRIGEYVMTAQDEEFVIKFAEPLLKEVLFQVFNNI